MVESEGGRRAIVSIADTWLKRYRGFKSKHAASAVDGILIYPCSSIHTIGMDFDIDVYFLDKDFRVVRRCPSVGPRQCRFIFGARYALELKSGQAAFPFASIGEKLSVRDERCWDVQ
ncbi:DUF192 domain-containing protein [Marinobacter daqiaonensis]